MLKTSKSSPLGDELLSKPSRRDFLAGSKVMATGLVLGFGAFSHAAHAAPGKTQVTLWLQVGEDNSITLAVGTADMGQGSAQSLATALCEELMVDSPASK